VSARGEGVYYGSFTPTSRTKREHHVSMATPRPRAQVEVPWMMQRPLVFTGYAYILKLLTSTYIHLLTLLNTSNFTQPQRHRSPQPCLIFATSRNSPLSRKISATSSIGTRLQLQARRRRCIINITMASLQAMATNTIVSTPCHRLRHLMGRCRCILVPHRPTQATSAALSSSVATLTRVHRVQLRCRKC
jgi:hypothetical protein